MNTCTYKSARLTQKTDFFLLCNRYTLAGLDYFAVPHYRNTLAIPTATHGSRSK